MSAHVMPYEVVSVVLNHDGSKHHETVSGNIFMPLEDARRDFREGITAAWALGVLGSEAGGTKYRVELRDEDTGRLVDSYNDITS